jgi:hypothetical protein
VRRAAAAVRPAAAGGAVDEPLAHGHPAMKPIDVPPRRGGTGDLAMH